MIKVKATTLLTWVVLALIAVFLVLWVTSVVGKYFLIAVIVAAVVWSAVRFVQGLRGGTS